MFLLDTSVVSELRKARAGNADKNVVAWAAGASAGSMFVSAITVVDIAVARRSAMLHVPDPRPVRDSLIAATALVHGMPVVTRNLGAFAPMGLDVIDPWRPVDHDT